MLVLGYGIQRIIRTTLPHYFTLIHRVHVVWRDGGTYGKFERVGLGIGGGFLRGLRIGEVLMLCEFTSGLLFRFRSVG